MTNASSEQDTEQWISVYNMSLTLLEVMDELPTWFDVQMWDPKTATWVVENCQEALDALEDCVSGLRESVIHHESSLAEIAFAEELCTDCQSHINFVWTELMNSGNL